MSPDATHHPSTSEHRRGPLRIVLTGGPGGGKTTAADLYRREIGDALVLVPESATTLFAGGFPRSHNDEAERSIQRAIFRVQRSLEDIQTSVFPDRVLLCDRGTVDGAAYWPDGPGHFFEQMGTTREAELARYDAVLFFETSAVGNVVLEGNRYRTESNDRAIDLDRSLRSIWSPHPALHVIGHERSFLRKITAGLSILRTVLDEHGIAGTGGDPS